MLSDPSLDLVQNDVPFGDLQFTVDEVQSLKLDVNKGAGLDSIKLPFFLTDLQEEAFLRDTDIQERQVQQRWRLS
jgi:hypothetical protein